jgi:7-cyano-7-deazaguanine synthase
MSRPKAVVCLSGGMDSTVCATLAARDYESYGLHFSYGQRTEARELEAARAVAEAVGFAELLELKTELFRRIGGSALTDLSIAVPDAAEEMRGSSPFASLQGQDDNEKQATTNKKQATTMLDAISERRGKDVPVTYVPFRNAHFLSAAVSWAEVLGAGTVFIGAVEQDSSGYPDCRPAYYDAFNRLIREGTKDGEIAVVTPLIRLKKAEIVRLGVELGAPLHVSWSCYSGETEACGMCESCVLRLRAFREAGATDPIPYARL